MRTSITRFFTLAALTLAAGACTVTARTRPVYYTADADVYYVESEPPPPRVEYRSSMPGSGYFWIDGYWDWRGNQWMWVSGHWERERSGYVYVRPRYEVRSGRRVYVPGRWDTGRSRVEDHRSGGGYTAPPARSHDDPRDHDQGRGNDWKNDDHRTVPPPSRADDHRAPPPRADDHRGQPERGQPERGQPDRGKPTREEDRDHGKGNDDRGRAGDKQDDDKGKGNDDKDKDKGKGRKPVDHRPPGR